MIKILYFAWLRDLIGKEGEEITLPKKVKTIEELIAFLSQKGSGYERAFLDLSAVKISCNHVLVGSKKSITAGDEIAFFPPFTGG